MKTRIESLGLYLPEQEVSTGELVSGMPVKPEFDVERITGVKRRRVRSDGESAYDMAINAAEDCLSHSRCNPEDIDIIINASITRTKDGERCFYEPPMSLLFKEHLGAHQALNFDITNACAGMATGTYILDSMMKAGQVKTGMVISGECITPIAETAVKETSGEMNDQFASLTVGDSGASFIMDCHGSVEEGIDFIEFMTVAGYSDLCIGGPAKRDTGLAMYTNLQGMQAADTPGTISKFIEEVFEKRGEPFEAAEYDYIIAHQVSVSKNGKYIKSIKEHFNTEPPENLMVVQDLGNTSSTSLFVVLYAYLQNGRLKRGDRLLIIPVASGLNFGLMSLTLGDLEVKWE